MKGCFAAAAACAALGVAVASAQSAPAMPGCAVPPGVSLDAMALDMGKLAPRVIEWGERRSRDVIASGAKLDAKSLKLAAAVGVKNPERIRMAVVDRIELPQEPMLRAAGTRVGLSQSADGMTLGYAVVVRRGHEANARLLSHEFRHVAQYEACGGIAAFLATHLAHLSLHGYDNSPFELDAERHERHGF